MTETTGTAPERELFYRTCDACAAQGVCVIVDDAYVCEACLAHHENAVTAAIYSVVDMLSPEALAGITGIDLRRVVEQAIKAYIEFDGDRAGEGPSREDADG